MEDPKQLRQAAKNFALEAFTKMKTNRSSLSSDHARKSQVRPDYTTWLAMRPHVLGAIAAAAKVIDSQGKTPTTEGIIELLSKCYSHEVIEIAWAELKPKLRRHPD